MKNIYLYISIVFVFCLLCCSASKYVQIDPKEKNPTEYVYPFSKDVIEKGIVKAFDTEDGYRYCQNQTVYFGKEPDRSRDALLSNSKFNTKDTLFFYLFNITCPSKVYFQKNGYSYTYTALFQFHIDSIDTNLTKVRIEVISPEVPSGLRWHKLPHGVRTWKYKKVPPTTVEEYEILQILGNTLGVKDMPEIKIPKKIVF